MLCRVRGRGGGVRVVVRSMRAGQAHGGAARGLGRNGSHQRREGRCPMDDYAPLIERAFSLAPRELSYAVGDVEGEPPEFIRGSYYLNGPARFARGGFNY